MRGSWSIFLYTAVVFLSPVISRAEEEKPVYRCLAPFVWQLESSKTPNNLFEAFLSGPFDRIGEGAFPDEESLLDEGWKVLLNGDMDDPRPYFREAWVRYGAGEGLLGMAFCSFDDPGFRKVFAEAAVENLPSGDPNRELAGVLAQPGEARLLTVDLETWMAENEGDEVVLFLLSRQLEEGRSLPFGVSAPLRHYLKGFPELGTFPIRMAANSGWPGRVRGNLDAVDLETARSGTLALAVACALDEGQLVLGVLFAEALAGRFPRVTTDLNFAREMAQLAWRLNQGEPAAMWLERWKRLIAERTVTGGEVVEKDPEYREWERRIREPNGDAGAASVPPLPKVEGLADMVEEIVGLFERGKTKDALFAMNGDLAAAVRSADDREALLERLREVLAAANRTPEKWIGERQVTIPLPVPFGAGELGDVPITYVGNRKPDESKPRLLLFYTGVGCPACQVQLQAFRGLSEKFANAGVELVAVSPQDGEETNKSLEASGQEFPFCFAGDPRLEVFEKLKMVDSFEAYPLHGAVLVDEKGKVLWSIRGYAPVTDAEKVFSAVVSRLETP